MVIWLVSILLLCKSWKYGCQDSSLCVCIPASKRKMGKEVDVSSSENLESPSQSPLLEPRRGKLSSLLSSHVPSWHQVSQHRHAGQSLRLGLMQQSLRQPPQSIDLERLTNVMQCMSSSHRDSGCLTQTFILFLTWIYNSIKHLRDNQRSSIELSRR